MQEKLAALSSHLSTFSDFFGQTWLPLRLADLLGAVPGPQRQISNKVGRFLLAVV